MLIQADKLKPRDLIYFIRKSGTTMNIGSYFYVHSSDKEETRLSMSLKDVRKNKFFPYSTESLKKCSALITDFQLSVIKKMSDIILTESGWNHQLAVNSVNSAVCCFLHSHEESPVFCAEEKTRINAEGETEEEFYSRKVDEALYDFGFYKRTNVPPDMKYIRICLNEPLKEDYMEARAGTDTFIVEVSEKDCSFLFDFCIPSDYSNDPNNPRGTLESLGSRGAERFTPPEKWHTVNRKSATLLNTAQKEAQKHDVGVHYVPLTWAAEKEWLDERSALEEKRKKALKEEKERKREWWEGE